MNDSLLHHLKYFGPMILSIAFFIGLFIYGVVKRNEPRGQKSMATGCGCLVILLLLAMVLPSINFNPIKSMESEVISNAYTIQIALERCAVHRHGVYPGDINDLITDRYLNDLITDDYLTEFPTNPFTKEPMRNTDFHDGRSEGEFTYLPVPDVNGNISGYYFIVYGHFGEEPHGEDVDGDGIKDNVILVVKSGVDPCTDNDAQVPDPPKLIDLLNPQEEVR